LAKNEPILIIFVEKISHPSDLVKNNSSDAACRIVDNILNTSTGCCHSHPIITEEDL